MTKVRDLALNIRKEKQILQNACSQRLQKTMLEELMKIIVIKKLLLLLNKVHQDSNCRL